MFGHGEVAGWSGEVAGWGGACLIKRNVIYCSIKRNVMYCYSFKEFVLLNLMEKFDKMNCYLFTL